MKPHYLKINFPLISNLSQMAGCLCVQNLCAFSSFAAIDFKKPMQLSDF